VRREGGVCGGEGGTGQADGGGREFVCHQLQAHHGNSAQRRGEAGRGGNKNVCVCVGGGGCKETTANAARQSFLPA
jgi:hypothetical protein